jgi:uroporphyrinogen-III synthase
MTGLLILRPEPGAADTAARARRLGLEPVTAPLFSIRPVPWEAPAPETVEALILTSANAARCGGETLTAFSRLPCYTVGETTAEAARAAGFTDIRTGPSDGAAVIRMMAEAGAGRALHLCGREHILLHHPRISIVRRIVYASEPATQLPVEVAAVLRKGALALLHSPRAGERFAHLVDDIGLVRGSIALAAISEAAAAAAGKGWKSVHTAPAPRDAALLELAAKLCQTERAAAG